jgi:hypothetical protein
VHKTLSIWKKYGFVWVTGLFFIVSLGLHWIFGWYAYLDEQKALDQPIDVGGYVIEMGRDTFENWQSEFLQLIWQVAGLALLLHVGSPQSKEGDDRVEAKLDVLLEKLDPVNGKSILADIDDRYGGRQTDPEFKKKKYE